MSMPQKQLVKLSIWQKLGYGSGDLASILFFQVQIIFLQN
jgi:Na+/melibiose symporter-like transporter